MYTQPHYQNEDFNPPCIGSVARSIDFAIDFACPGSMYPSTEPTSVAEQQSEHITDSHTPNIVIYGETGVGKSSIINLIAGHKLAHTSNDALGCTFQHQRHIVEWDGVSCALWDTTGLDEGTEGTVPARLAEGNLRTLMQELAQSGGIHLVIYCTRGVRLTKALKRNYDLFYVTVCRKKVPVALVVTGLEHQEGEMETWWNENEVVLRRHGMRFDAHACVTTLDIQDDVIQARRSDSQRRLRELVGGYCRLPAWRTDQSFISRIFPVFRSVLRRASSTSRNTATVRKVIVCDVAEDAPVGLSPGITAAWERCTGWIGDVQYEFVRMHKHALPVQMPTSRPSDHVGASVLVFYTSPLLDNHISPTDVDALRKFYDIAGGQLCPVIVVLRGCNNEEVARTCRRDVVSRHSDIQAHFVSLSSAVDGQFNAQTKLDDMIERLCVEHVKVKTPKFHRRYTAGKRLLATVVGRITPGDRAHGRVGARLTWRPPHRRNPS